MAGPTQSGSWLQKLIVCLIAPVGKFTRLQHRATAAFTLTHRDQRGSCIERGAFVGHRCAVNDAHREPRDAPPLRSRRALLAGAGALLLVLAGGTLLLRLAVPPPLPPRVQAWRLPATAFETVALPTAEPVAVAAVPSPEVVQPLPQRRSSAVAGAAAARAPQTTIVIAETVGGDAVVRKAMVRAFGRGLKGLQMRAQSDTGYSVTLHVDEQQQRGEVVVVRCAVAIALLPRQNILASVKARAEVEGSDTPVDELYGDAAEACGQTLASDLAAWVKAHPL